MSYEEKRPLITIEQAAELAALIQEFNECAQKHSEVDNLTQKLADELFEKAEKVVNLASELSVASKSAMKKRKIWPNRRSIRPVGGKINIQNLGRIKVQKLCSSAVQDVEHRLLCLFNEYREPQKFSAPKYRTAPYFLVGRIVSDIPKPSQK